jgi:hypothetical protein
VLLASFAAAHHPGLPPNLFACLPVQVTVLDAAAMQYLEPGLRTDLAVLRLLGAAFPVGHEISTLAFDTPGRSK